MKSPLVAELNRTRCLGVEHEFFVPVLGSTDRATVQRQIADILSANGIRAIARPYNHSVLASNIDVAVETDGSVSGTHTWAGVQHAPIELKTRIINYSEYERIVPKTLQIVQYLGGRVNSSCGYHVHLALPEVHEHPSVIRSLYNLFHRFEPVIIGSLVSPSRRDNGYCRPMPDVARRLHACTSLATYRRALGNWDRYFGLNLTHLWSENPHVELRYHQGTLDADKAAHWVKFCLQMIQHAVNRNCQSTNEQVPNDKKGMNRLLTSCGFKPNTGIYSSVSPELRETGRYLLLKRFRHFNRQAKTNPGGEDC